MHILDLSYTASGAQAPFLEGNWEDTSLSFVGVEIDTYGRHFTRRQYTMSGGAGRAAYGMPGPPKICGPGTAMYKQSVRHWTKAIREFLDHSIFFETHNDTKELVLARTISWTYKRCSELSDDDIIEGLNLRVRMNYKFLLDACRNKLDAGGYRRRE